MPRQLMNAQITHVSLVDKGANNKKFAIVKSNTPPIFEKKVEFLKSDAEQQLVTGVVYEPDVMDAHDDYMTALDIEKAAHQFLTDYRHIDKQHDFISNVGDVVESWIAKSDMKIGEEDITAGTWVMTVKVSDNDSWEAIKKGDVTGFSMAGLAETIQKENTKSTEAPSDDEKGLISAIKQWFISKGAVRDEFNRTKARRDLWSVFSALENEFDSAIWNNQTPQPADFERIENATQEFLEILSEIKTSEDIEKVLKQKPKEENNMTTEQMAEALAKALEPVNKRLDDIEKNSQVDDSSGTKTDEEKLAAALAKAVEPINKRLEAIEKVRDSSKQQQTDNQTTPVSKSNDYLQYFGTN